MKTISVLDKNTIDKIAAGEVIERPSSIVKELVENAIDAGSNAVTVEIKDGGTTLVRITDNGEGIAPSEVKKAFMRHATSKITKAEDLFGITSLGFRGEALSSIAAVCQVELITKTAGELTGVRYAIEGGEKRPRNPRRSERRKVRPLRYAMCSIIRRFAGNFSKALRLRQVISTI